MDGDEYSDEGFPLDLEDELRVSAPSGDALASIEELVNKALGFMRSIDEAEAFLKATKADLHSLTTRTLPAALASASTELFVTDKGAKVEIKSFLNGSLPKEEPAKTVALKYLKEIGAEDIIKDQLTVSFDKGDHNIAGDVRAYLDELGLAYESKTGVHSQTLAATARERMRKSEAIELDKLGLYAGRAAKITLLSKKEK